MAAWTFRTRVGLLAASLLAVAIVAAAGCSSPTSRAVSSAEPATAARVMGPYPAGLAVMLNGVSFSLESVEVTDRQSYADSSAVAPGRRKVNVAFAFRGPGTNPAPGGGFFYPNMQLIVDGKEVPIDGGGLESGYDVEAPEGIAPRETLSFEVPADAQSAVMRVIPSFADTQTVAFRLW